MNSIPADQLVDVVPSVLSAGGNPLSLNAVFLTNDSSIPLGTVKAFSGLTGVQNWFGATSIEAILAGIYFAGYENAQTLPGTLYFAQYNEGNVAAYLRSGSFQGVTLPQLQTLSGQLIVSIDGRVVTSANIDLSTATSFTNAAALIQAGIQTPGGIFSGQATIDDGAGGAGTLLTVTVATTGALHVGDTLAGAGVAGATTITALGTGTGGVGTYHLSGAAQHVAVAEAMTAATAATVSYDAQLAEFVINSPTTGVNSALGFATGSLSAGLKFTAATGAVTSQGAAAATPAGTMAAVVLATKNWATFMTTFEPDLTTKLGFAAWVQTMKKRYAYVAWDSDATPLAGDAPASFAAQCVTGAFDGIFPIYEPATDQGSGRKAALVCGITASIDWTQTEGRLTYAYKGQAGLIPDITDEETANNLKANGYNFYGEYGTGSDLFVNLQRGSTPGAYKFFDSFVNQIWFNNALQVATLVMMMRFRSIPYTTPGYNICRATWLDPIQQALNNGVIRTGVTLSNGQKAAVNTAAGLNIGDVLQTSGFYIQIKDADPTVRGNRGSPPSTIWYTDGQSIQNIVLSSINVL